MGLVNPEVVDAEPLGSILRAWVVKWLAERPRHLGKGFHGGNERTQKPEFVGPINWLAQETGIHVSRVQKICNSKHPFVPLTQADLLLTAIGENYRLAGEIKIKPNPRWSMERWQEYMAEKGCV